MGCQVLGEESLAFLGNCPTLTDVITWQMNSLNILSVLSSS